MGFQIMGTAHLGAPPEGVARCVCATSVKGQDGCPLHQVPVRVIDPCATCDRPENAHADHCAMHPDNWGREAIPSDIPGTATVRR